MLFQDYPRLTYTLVLILQRLEYTNDFLAKMRAGLAALARAVCTHGEPEHCLYF